MTLRCGCRAWKKMLPMWRQEMVTWLIAGQAKEHSFSVCWSGSRWHRRQGKPQFPRDTSGGSPSSGGGSFNCWSNQSSQQSTLIRVSGESNWPAWPGRGLRVTVNLPIFKDEKTKDAVTYHSWQWDIAMFCCSGWENQHLLPYVLWSLQDFSGDLARSLGEDATLNDVLQTLDEHYGILMTFDNLSKELYSLK